MIWGRDVILPKERGVGFWNLAEKFVEAGDKLQPPINTLAFFPLFLLYGHGIELGLKAFLISQGTTEKALRDIGHDLTRALDAARGSFRSNAPSTKALGICSSA